MNLFLFEKTFKFFVKIFLNTHFVWDQSGAKEVLAFESHTRPGKDVCVWEREFVLATTVVGMGVWMMDGAG